MKRYTYLFVILSALLLSGVTFGEFLVRTVSTTQDGNTFTLETMDILEGDFLLNMGCRMDTGAVDIVFAIDSTGSMGGELADVRATIGDFAAAMEASGFDYALGGITFGDGENVWDFDPSTPGVYDLTTDIAEFETKLAGVGASGGGDGPETAMDAIYNAATMYNWRPYAIHIIIMFTDIRYCTTDYPSGSGCCCDAETEVSEDEVMDAVVTGGNICYNIYGSSWGSFDTRAATMFDLMSDTTGGESYDLDVGFESIFDEVITHLGEYASIYIDVQNTGSSTVDSIIAEVDLGDCLTPLSATVKVVRDIEAGERVFFGWPIDIDSLCIGGERCFNIYLTASDGYTDTIFGCTTTEDCHCIGPAVTVALPTPTGRISACEDQAILFHTEAAFGVELDNATVEVVVDGVTYTEDDPELSVASPFVSFNPTEMWEHGDSIYFCLAAMADLNGCPIAEPTCSEFYVDLIDPQAEAIEPAEGDTFFTDIFEVEIGVSDDIAGIDLETSFITINGDTFALEGSDFVSYSGDESGGSITVSGNAVLDFGFTPMDTAEVCFHGTDLVIDEYCGPNEGVHCFSWPIMLLTREVWFGEMQAAPCETVLVPVYIDTIQVAQIENIHFEIEFNPEVLQPINIVYDGTITEGWTGTYDIMPDSGWISADIHGTRLDAGLAGVLFYIRGVVPCGAGGGDFTTLDIQDFVFNAGFPMCDHYDGFFISTWRVQTWLMDIIINKTETRVLDQNLAIGASMHTTDNYEPGSDLPILPPTPDHVNAYLMLDDPSYPFITALRRDMRAMEPPVRWVINTVGEGEPMDMIEGYAHWDPSRLPEGNFIMNGVLDMKSDTMITFNLGESLVIDWLMPDLASSDIEMHCTGWNLLSLPTVPPSYPPSEVFPHSPVGVFEFDTQRKTYLEAERFSAGKGYWLYSPMDTSVTIAGVELMNYNMNLYMGWNLIGAISEPVDVDAICTSEDGIILEPIYEYNCETGEYIDATTLEPGKGYWLLATGEGVLSVPSGSMYCRPFIELTEPLWTGNVIVDGSPFVFGYSERAKTSLDAMDIVMPPAAPEDATTTAFIRDDFFMRKDITAGFDWVMMIDHGADLEFDLPKEVGLLELTGPDGLSMTIYDGMKIDNATGGIYRLAASGAPAEFELLGAYPNPFNAAVEISFIMPEDGNVKMDVYDITGHKVETLLDEEIGSGKNTVRWEADDQPSGLYFYRVNNGEKTITGTISLIK